MFIEDISKLSQLPQPPLGLLPAVHDATVVDVEELPTADLAQNVWRNDGGEPIVLPAWGRWPARAVEPGEHFAHDGRLFYKVQQRLHPAAGETSWYPTAFERVLYTIHLSARQLPTRSSWAFDREFWFRLVANSTNAVWSVYFEVGVKTVQTTPSPTGPNLADYTWLPPMIEEQIVITDVAGSHALGVVINNNLDGYTGSRLLYARAEAIPEAALPTVPEFAVRVRLGCFDTQNSVADPKGYAAYVAKDTKRS